MLLITILGLDGLHLYRRLTRPARNDHDPEIERL